MSVWRARGTWPQVGPAATFIACVVVLLRQSPVQSAELVVGTWNVRKLSAASRDGQERTEILDRLVAFDLVALQEAMDDSTVYILADSLRTRGAAFEAVQGPAHGVPPNDERYAFLYRPDRIQLLGELQTWPDPLDQISREPAWAWFRAGAFGFAVVTVHVVYGDRVADRRAEVVLLDDVVRDVLAAVPGEEDVLLVGDFNPVPGDVAFSDLRQTMVPLFPDGAGTTIADNDLDNVWLDPRATREYTGAASVDRFDETVFGGDDSVASLRVSDHRPLLVTFFVDGPDDDGVPTLVEVASWAAVKLTVCRPEP